MWPRDKKGHVRAGLYCSKHAKWIKWLPQEELDMAVKMGTPQQDTLNKKSRIRKALKQNG
jgi:hypothetical protein